MENSRKKYLFIVNPISGNGKKNKVVETIHREMKGFPSNYDLVYTEYPQHATSLTENAVYEGYDFVVAVGGDGTANEVGKVLVNTNCALGIIPCGSGNGLALHLKMPSNPKQAMKKIKGACQREVDTASINGNVFLSVAGIGFDAHIGWKFAEFGKRGMLSYAQLSAREFFRYQPMEYVLEVDGKRIESNAFLISFTKSGQFGNNVWIDPEAKLDDGYISLCILEKFPLSNTLNLLFRMLTNKLEKSKYFRVIKAREIRVIKGFSMLHMDGEPSSSEKELLIKVQPKSLKIIC